MKTLILSVIFIQLFWCAGALISYVIIRKHIILIQQMQFELAQLQLDPLIQVLVELREKMNKGSNA